MPFISGGSGGGAVTAAAIEGTFTAAGQVYQGTGAGTGALVKPPGFEIGYSQITAPVNIASTTEATGTTIISPGALTFDGTPVLCHFYAPYFENGTAAGLSCHICLFEGVTQIGRICSLVLASGTLQQALTMSGFLRFTPTAASHTYTITAFATNTTGTPQVGAGATGTGAWVPAFVRFTKV